MSQLNPEYSPPVSTKEERALKHVQKFMDESRRYVRPFHEKFSKIFEEYLVSRTHTRNPLTRAQLRPAYAFIITESYLPHLIEAFFADKPYINVLGRDQQDMMFEQQIQEYISYQLDRMGVIEKFSIFFKDLLLYGTAVAKLRWNYQTKNVLFEQDGKKYYYEQPEKDEPEIEPIPIWDFFPDPAASTPGCVDSMYGCVHRLYRSFEELKAKEKKKDALGNEIGIYSNLEKLQQDKDSEKAYQPTGDSSKDYFRRDAALDLEPDIKRKNKIELWEYWGKFCPKDDGKEYEYVITIADGKTVIRCDANPLDGNYKPFLAGVNYPTPGEFFGVGEIEPVWSMIKEAAALRNARLDTVNQAVNRMWLVDRTAGINTRNLYTRAGGIILANDINGIKPLDPPEVVGSAFREITELDYGIQQAVALPNPGGQGGQYAPGFSRTAEGIKFLSSLTTTRLGLKIRLIANMVINRLATRLMMLNRQFLTDDVYFRVTNDQQNPFRMLPLDAFSKNYDFSVASAFDRLSRKDRQVQYQQNIIPIMQMGEQYRPGLIKWETFIPKVLQDFEFRETNQFVASPQEQQTYQQGVQQSQMQMAEHNAMVQAQSQAMLAQATGQVNIQETQATEQARLMRDLANKAVDVSQQDENNEQQMAREVMKATVNAASKRQSDRTPKR